MLRHLLERASGNSVDLVVTSLVALQQSPTEALASLRRFLNALAVHAPSDAADEPPRNILIVGTCKDGVNGGERAVRELSELVYSELHSCPAFRRVRRNEKEDLWLHAIENSRSTYCGADFDGSIQQLALAIDAATDELPSMTELVPPRWLSVIDRMQAGGRQQLTLDEAFGIAAECGLPHAGFALADELHALLGYFHSLGALLWCATAQMPNAPRRDAPIDTRPNNHPPP